VAAAAEKQMQVPIRLRSGQAFDSAEERFAQDDRFIFDSKKTEQQILGSTEE
jgi:hypothetical protein